MAIQIISRQNLAAQNLAKRKARVEAMQPHPHMDRQQQREFMRVRDNMLAELETGNIPRARLPESFQAEQHVRTGIGKEGVLAEFIGTGNFAKEFYERQRYEVDAGRDLEPELYPAVYAVTIDANLPRMIPINVLGPAGVVFERVDEGGQVQFATVGEYTKSVELFLYATGIEYTEDLFLYNEYFRLANIERQFGQAYNALLNHVHMAPILDASLTGNNATDGTSLTTFKTSASMPEKYLRTIEAAITAAATDKTNPRRGPYILLVSSADVFTAERALNRVPQQGFDAQSSALARVQGVVEYDGWSGQRGKKAVTYDGVPAGTAFLIDLANRTTDFQSYFKHQLRTAMDEGDLMRYIMSRTRYDVRFGVFADPKRAVHKITWPVAGSGAS